MTIGRVELRAPRGGSRAGTDISAIGPHAFLDDERDKPEADHDGRVAEDGVSQAHQHRQTSGRYGGQAERDVGHHVRHREELAAVGGVEGLGEGGDGTEGGQPGGTEALPAGARLTVDLTTTTYLPSAGIGLLVDVIEGARARGVDLRLLTEPSGLPARALALTGLDAPDAVNPSSVT
jgi:hypothetical protein